ncbi:MAG: hypothetical protein DRJ64_09550 [Thermoprotei archaeon]|nr:MAG: hypothetical protein DRJ64_09550 [Thermoprotei archaeon]
MLSTITLVNSLILILLTVMCTIAFKTATIKKKFRVLKLISTYTIISFLSNVYLLGMTTSSMLDLDTLTVGVSLLLNIISIILLWCLVYRYWSD